ncbi:histidine triad (HIT) family protein [Maridesulfovibrio ferrireducens]|uniref:Histidine triad (HIT) family protein n=1 Tax=Maridesulfovibrio ferrireducens TaxID=246191 RepID=A0A1G9CCE3_9BACT|nr:HIT family protein [Maridesulfovibrio ferrireducens]SDK49327.1 histidine triad (HIT) family protein [Maridesulfovibrio ferrireducens]
MNNQDCIFCKIVAGDIPCFKIYETENILSFLDIGPVNKGHALVIPKGHYKNLWDIPADLGKELMTAAQVAGDAIVKATGADGLNLLMNNNDAAGQLVFHAHFHLIPRFKDDGLKLWDQGEYNDMDEAMALAQKIEKMIK